MVTWQHKKENYNLDQYDNDNKGTKLYGPVLHAIVEAYEDQVHADITSNHALHASEKISEKLTKEQYNYSSRGL